MPSRVLVATFGFNERRVLPALRFLPYDRLVLVGGQESLQTAGFLRLKALEPALDVVLVDPYDLLDCLQSVCKAFHEARASGGEVRISVAGGTKVLADAAVLAAFQEGVEAWYCDPEPVRLPVLRGVRILDALGPAERLVASLLERSMTSEALVRTAGARGLPPSGARKALRILRDSGLLTEHLVRGA